MSGLLLGLLVAVSVVALTSAACEQNGVPPSEYTTNYHFHSKSIAKSWQRTSFTQPWSENKVGAPKRLSGKGGSGFIWRKGSGFEKGTFQFPFQNLFENVECFVKNYSKRRWIRSVWAVGSCPDRKTHGGQHDQTTRLLENGWLAKMKETQDGITTELKTI